MTCALLISLLSYLRYAGFLSVTHHVLERKSRGKSSHSARSSPLWLITSVVAYFAALLTKETSIIFLVVIFAVAISVSSREKEPSGSSSGTHFDSRLRTPLLHSAPFVCATVVYFLLRLKALGGKFDVATQHLTISTLLLSWPATLWFYFKVMLWPVRSYSFADPTLIERFSLRGVWLPFFELACCAALLTVLSAYCWRNAERESATRQAAGIRISLISGILLLILPLLLALNLNGLNPGDFLHGRYTYLPLAGLTLLLATAWHSMKKFRVVLLCSARFIFSVCLSQAPAFLWPAMSPALRYRGP